MDRPRLYRGLRIAVSAVFGILCVLLIVLWVHSYCARDSCRGMIGKSVLNIQSLRGDLGIGVWEWRFKPVPWSAISEPDNMDSLWPPVKGKPPLSRLGFRWLKTVPDQTFVVLPYWFVLLIPATLAAAPWIHWSKRFSLRTLLIATTLIAVVLGLVVWSLRTEGKTTSVFGCYNRIRTQEEF